MDIDVLEIPPLLVQGEIVVIVLPVELGGEFESEHGQVGVSDFLGVDDGSVPSSEHLFVSVSH